MPRCRASIYGLQEARAQDTLHFERGTDDTVDHQTLNFGPWFLGGLGGLAVHSAESPPPHTQLRALSTFNPCGALGRQR
jgi:hypothetical protein